MEKHITIVGILHITLGIIMFLVGMFVFLAVAGGGLLSQDMEAIFITSLVGSAIAIFFILLSIPGIIGGIGLLNHKGWARILVLVISVLDLIQIPYGTIIGAYSIWVLLQKETESLMT